MSLALKYRPKCWQEVIGQPTVISILQRQVATKTWKSCYLFSGAFGCGKTTVARIFAKEINDDQGEPIEIDGASNNGVDAIRALIADAQVSSLDCNYKVYIIDEAHMITTQGWNAALKLIEDPPVGTVFIFCTTNPEKLPDTILSRVQRFDFKKVSSNIIANHLKYIMNEELHSDYDDLALETIAINCNGHVRDALQMLDKCLDMSDIVTVDLVNSALGSVNINSIVELLNSSYDKNFERCLDIINSFEDISCDALKIYDDLIELAIDCTIYKKLNKISVVNIPESILSNLNFSYDLAKAISNRLLAYRKHADRSNAFTFLKYIFMEVCDR